MHLSSTTIVSPNACFPMTNRKHYLTLTTWNSHMRSLCTKTKSSSHPKHNTIVLKTVHKPHIFSCCINNITGMFLWQLWNPINLLSELEWNNGHATEKHNYIFIKIVVFNKFTRIILHWYECTVINVQLQLHLPHICQLYEKCTDMYINAKENA